MNDFKLKPEGFFKLFFLVILLVIGLMVLPYFFQAINWALNIFKNPPPNPEEIQTILYPVLIAIALGLGVGAAIRFIRTSIPYPHEKNDKE